MLLEAPLLLLPEGLQSEIRRDFKFFLLKLRLFHTFTSEDSQILSGLAICNQIPVPLLDNQSVGLDYSHCAFAAGLPVLQLQLQRFPYSGTDRLQTG
ncbi:hypothetical protein D3C73_1237020 [compost metagenome]